MHKVSADYAPSGDNNTNIKVYIRTRPPDDKSVVSDFIVVDPDNDKKITIRDPDAASRKYGEVSFQFDEVFWTETKQTEVYNAVCESQLSHVLSGYNTCIFAYGQTGSGKTYSMFGEDAEIRGIIPRSVEDLFKALNKQSANTEVAMVCSFLEIYNDQIRDLAKAYLVAMGVETSNSAALFEKTSTIVASLSAKRGNHYFQPAFSKSREKAMEVGARPGLKECVDEYNTMNHEIHEDAEGNVYVKDLSLVPVSNLDEVMSLINMGLKVRATHETKMNSSSSRSHTVFSITVIQRDKLTGESIQGTMNLIDLAGSERLKKSESQGIRLKEALHINTSLTALGKVIMALDPNSENSHIPFRDSKLTRILQNSLGGNSYTSVLAALHPHPRHYDECLSTLQFANRCRVVRNNPRINHVVDNEDKDRKIKRLLEEIAQLRLKIGQLEGGRGATGKAAGGKGSAIASMSAIVQVLKKLGINANIGADGNITANGTTLAVEDLAALGLGGDDSVASGSVIDDSSVPFGAAGRDGSSGSGKTRSGDDKSGKDKGKSQLNEYKEQVASLTAKNKERKTVMDEQGKQMQEMSNEIVKLQTIIKHKEFEYKCLMEEKERALAQLKQDLEAHTRVLLTDVSHNNTKLLNAQQDTLLAVPDSFKKYTTLIRKVETQKDSFEGPIRAEFEEHLETLESSRLKEISNIQSQYEFWIKERDDNLKDFVDKFNEYRLKKSEQIRMCEKEIIKLFEYIESLEHLLARIEKGEFTVRSHQGPNGKSTTGLVATSALANQTAGGDFAGGATMGGIVLPAGTRPHNPLYRSSNKDMELSKLLIQKHRERQYKLEKVKNDAFEKSLHHATRISSIAAVGNIDGVLQKQLSDLLVKPVSHKTHKNAFSKSMGHVDASVHETQDATNNNSAVGELMGYGNQTGVGERKCKDDGDAKDDVSQNSQGSGTRFTGNNAKLNELAALKEEVAMLRSMKHLQEVSVEKVAQEIASDDTISYIRHLEDEVDKLRRSCQDAHSQLQNSKTAQAALVRKLDKTAAALTAITMAKTGTVGPTNTTSNINNSRSGGQIGGIESGSSNNIANFTSGSRIVEMGVGSIAGGSTSTASKSVRPSTGGLMRS